MEKTVVVYPSPGMGHLRPMVELAKLFAVHGFSVAVVLMDSPVKHPSMDAFVSRIRSSHPSIFFHNLPPPSSFHDSTSDQIVDLLNIVRVNTPQMLRFLAGYTRTFDVRAVVLDFFCTDALDATAELCLPSYFLFSSGACGLSGFLYMSTMHSIVGCSYMDLGDAPIKFPGVPPIPASDMPPETQDRDRDSYKGLLTVSDRLLDGDGILLNTFESLEAVAVQALRRGACVPGRRMPPIYCIGPLVQESSQSRDEEEAGNSERAECLVWLYSQPRRSVVFLCFGSLGTFSAEQLKEIAAGLEKSEQRFLWVVNSPRAEINGPQEEPVLEELLPEGFVERTKGRGLVVKSWAPQVEVLNHEAVGVFVTHCGWNSILEAITAGVAMVAWPLYAEQRTNKVYLVELMRLGVVMEGYNRDLVPAEEVEAKLRWLMETEGGRELKERTAEAKERAAAVRKEGGSSYRAWMELMHTLNGHD